MIEDSTICVVNVAQGGWYPQGQDRLINSLRPVGYGGLVRWYRNALPSGSPSHRDAPYAFKVYAVQEALAGEAPPRYVIWADSSTVFLRHPSVLAEAASMNGGVACWLAGWTAGEWTRDLALPILGITREEAFGYSLVVGGVWCIDTKSNRAMDFLSRLRGFADAGAFAGPWDNVQFEASTDPRVKGHRHDMPAMAVALRRAGLAPLQDHALWSYWDSRWTADPGLQVRERPHLAVASRGWGQ